MPKGPKLEARRAESGIRELAPPHKLRDVGSGISSPSGVRGEAPPEIEFCVFLIPQKTFNWDLTAFDGKNFGP